MVATQGPHRRLLCRHEPRGTVAWPADLDDFMRAPVHASVYSCDRGACIDDAMRWVEERTGHLGVYRAFPVRESA